MTQPNTISCARCVKTLDQAFAKSNLQAPDSVEWADSSAAFVDVFEIVLEQLGKLLKILKPCFAPCNEADKLMFKDIFRMAGKHSLIGLNEAGHRMKYRDNRDETAYD